MSDFFRKCYLCIAFKLSCMSEAFKSLFQHAANQGYKANVVKPLIGMAAILLFIGLMLMYIEQDIMGYIIFGSAIVMVIVFVISYFMCLAKDPDLLRSERFVIEKSALEKVSISGDSTFPGTINLPHLDYLKIESIKELDKCRREDQ